MDNVKAIADLWPLAAILFASGCVIGYRTQIGKLLERLGNFSIKRNGTEISVTQQSNLNPPRAIADETAETGEPPKLEDKKFQELEEKSGDGLWDEMFRAFNEVDLDRARSIFKRIQHDETDAAQRQKNEGIFEWKSFLVGDTGASDRLRALASHGEAKAEVFYWLASCYEFASEFEHAASAYSKAFEHARNPMQRAQYIVSAANCQYKGGKRAEAISLLKKEILSESETEAKIIIIQGIATLYRLEGDDELHSLNLERALKLRPNDTKLRFQLAYAYSENRQHALAILHYQQLLGFGDNSMAINNLGVLFDNVLMPINAAHCFERSIELKNSLAVANLAQKLLAAGFAGKAQEAIEFADGFSDKHPNTSHVLSSIAANRDREQAQKVEILDSARRQQQFLIQYFDKIDEQFIENIDGHWDSRLSKLSLKYSAQAVEGQLTYDNKNYKLKGRVKGRTIKVESFFCIDVEYTHDKFDLGRGFFSDENALMLMIVRGDKSIIFEFKKKAD